jgi:hypothetical protein
VDVFRLKLDGSGETEQLADLAQKLAESGRRRVPARSAAERP